MIDFTKLNEKEAAIYAAGYAAAVLDRRERDRKETEQLVRQCTRRPDPLTHYREQLRQSEAA